MSRKCEGYALAMLPGASFCNKNSARRVANLMSDGAARIATLQAEVATLKATGKEAVETAQRAAAALTVEIWAHATARVALAERDGAIAEAAAAKRDRDIARHRAAAAELHAARLAAVVEVTTNALVQWRSLPSDPNFGTPLGAELLRLYERDADRAIANSRKVLP